MDHVRTAQELRPLANDARPTVRDLSRTAGGFLWLDNLNEPDPYKILPIMAGIFQFVQTKMMRPANAPRKLVSGK